MLDKATGERSLLLAMAKSFSAELIARRKVRLIRPNTYTAAEAKTLSQANCQRVYDLVGQMI